MSGELTDMEKRQIKVATRQLLDEFPNLQEAAKLCRMGATRLSQYQYFDAPAFMPIDVVFVLERAVRKPVLTGQVLKMHQAVWPVPEGDVASEVMDLAPALGDLVTFIKQATHKASHGGMRFSEVEKRAYQEIRARMEKELREVDLAVEQDQVVPLPAV
jgi:hypothetical protein